MQLPTGPIPAELVRQSILRPSYIRLPICDLLFCTFSLSLHVVAFASVLLAAYRLKNLDCFVTFCILVGLAGLATLTVSVTSFIWYLTNTNDAFRRVDLGLHVTVHILQLTTPWRHYLLFRQIPENVVKFLFCELLSLRLLHAAIFGLPSSLILFFTLFLNGQDVSEVRTPLLTAAVLTLTDLCFSWASFNRHTNRNRADLLILSWPSILCQFGWRLGTVGARCVILAAFATAFLYLTVIVIGLHWLLMFLGLFMFTRPKRDPSTGTSCQWIGHCFFLALVHIICFFNPTKDGVKWRCAAFYIVMFLENSLLLVLWLLLSKPTTDWVLPLVLGMGWGGFVFGIIMMLIYYRYLHVTKLKAVFGNVSEDRMEKTLPQSRNGSAGTFVCKLPTLPSSFRAVTKQEVVTIAKRYQRTPEGSPNQKQESPAKSSPWSRNSRRCRSVPNDQRRRSNGEVPSSIVFAESEIRTENTQTRVVVTRIKGHSLPRRIKNTQRFAEVETSSPNDSPNGHQAIERTRDNLVPRSTFIETIF